jgi:2-polyprenyl-3-methyl-5-hydroxy-6-metoxy-1,4-benzoquinol methylase
MQAQTDDRRSHWESVYAAKAPDQASWFQPTAAASLRLLDDAGVGPGARLVDVGGGASPLAGELLRRGWTDVTVLDIAAGALEAARTALGADADKIGWHVADVLDWRPQQSFDVWHDRAVFHFLTEPDQRARYRRVVAGALRPGGWVVLGVFGTEGPERCSGLGVQRWSAEGLAEEFGPAFALRQTFDERHQTPDGAAQMFTWVLLERIG